MGTHAGSGIVGSLLAFFGINYRMKNLEEDLKGFKERVVYRDTCTMCQKNSDNQFKSLDEKLNLILERLP